MLLLIRKSSGVAVGSSIGHAIGGFFGGGSSQAAADGQQSDSALATQATEGNYQSNGVSRSCEPDAKAFTRCLDENKGEYQMSVCGWYLEQLVSLCALYSRHSRLKANGESRKLASLLPANTNTPFPRVSRTRR